MKLCEQCFELFSDDATFCPHDGTVLKRNTDRFLGRTIAARYRLIKRLGAGGMSVVYLARHELINRLSAIKILRPELASFTEHRERFLREARAVNRINHGNIVEITDVGESDGIAYLVMEYVEGETLFAHVQRGRLPWPRALQIGMQLASALARAHQMGVIHRDLKPENILLAPSADPDVVQAKLTDFGIAKMTGEPMLTLSSQLFGTPGYIAPEYLGGVGIDSRSDIYSLGVVIYEMVTGVLPFDGRGQSELLLKPLTSSPIPPSQRVGDLPPELESLLLRCLSRDPEGRPHDAFAVHDALAEIIRRFAGHMRSSSSSIPSVRRDASETIFDAISVAPFDEFARDPTKPGPNVTQELSSRWHKALAELEQLIASAWKKGGPHTKAAATAAELSLVASEMIPRVERAAKVVGELQTKVDLFESSGREFRQNLGCAIDTLGHDRSREQSHLDALRARRIALEGAVAMSPEGTAPLLPPLFRLSEPTPSGDARVWEVDALHQEEERAETSVSDLTFQLDTLQAQLESKNEQLERDLVHATGTLEGSLSALRRLTKEVVHTIEDGIAILQRAG